MDFVYGRVLNWMEVKYPIEILQWVILYGLRPENSFLGSRVSWATLGPPVAQGRWRNFSNRCDEAKPSSKYLCLMPFHFTFSVWFSQAEVWNSSIRETSRGCRLKLIKHSPWAYVVQINKIKSWMWEPNLTHPHHLANLFPGIQRVPRPLGQEGWGIYFENHSLVNH